MHHHNPPHSHSVSHSDSTPLGILCPGGSCKNSAKSHWCWVSDFYPFGMSMPERSYSSTAAGYRYAFNGKELDPVGMGGGGSTYDYGFRIYNAQIGKFLSVDPLTKSYPSWSPYPFAMNSPISGVDLDGLEYFYAADGTLLGKIGTSQQVRLIDEKTITIEQATKMIQLANNLGLTSDDVTPYLDKYSCDIGMTNQELMARAFMTVVRRGEASSKSEISKTPLAYNVNYGGKTFSSFKTHPNNKVSSGGFSSEAAGAYQIMFDTWKMINRVESQPDFSPTSQDRAFLIIVEIVNDDLHPGLLDAFYDGDFEKTANWLNKTWTPLPGSGKQSKMTMEKGKEMFKEAISNELSGNSDIDTPQGQLNMQKVYRE